MIPRGRTPRLDGGEPSGGRSAPGRRIPHPSSRHRRAAVDRPQGARSTTTRPADRSGFSRSGTRRHRAVRKARDAARGQRENATGPCSTASTKASASSDSWTGLADPSATTCMSRPIAPSRTISESTTRVGRTLRDIIPDEGAEGWLGIYGDVLRTGEPVRFQRQFAPNGPPGGRRASRRAGQPQEVAVLFTDVTARKEAEAALRASEGAGA